MKTILVDEKAIRRQMVEIGIRTINELASRSGVSKPTIYDYLNGKPPLSDAFIRLCNCLELSPIDILVEKEKEEVTNFNV